MITPSKSALTAGTAFLLALSSAGCGGSGKSHSGSGSAASGGAAPASSAANVDIASFKFAPPAIVVKAGGKVTWTNHDSAPHTATAKADPSIFDTGTLKQGQSKTLTLTKPGTYSYYCLFHAFMVGKITVK